MGRSKPVYDALMKLWPLGKVHYWLADRPPLRRLMRSQFSAEDNEAIIIPVGETVRGDQSVVLPYQLLTPLLERASARVVMNRCLCRQGEGCHTYPRDVGCIFLGPGAAEIDRALGWPVGVEGALAHAGRAMRAGLTPLVVHSAFDAWIVGIPYRRMLAVCFCCDCCCTIRQGLRLGPPAFWDTVIRLQGLAMAVGDTCTGCGSCVDVCPVGAISLKNGRAHAGEACKGCGRCVDVCPAGAVSMHVAEEVDVLGHLLARIERRTEI